MNSNSISQTEKIAYGLAARAILRGGQKVLGRGMSTVAKRPATVGMVGGGVVGAGTAGPDATIGQRLQRGVMGAALGGLGMGYAGARGAFGTFNAAGKGMTGLARRGRFMQTAGGRRMAAHQRKLTALGRTGRSVAGPQKAIGIARGTNRWMNPMTGKVIPLGIAASMGAGAGGQHVKIKAKEQYTEQANMAAAQALNQLANTGWMQRAGYLFAPGKAVNRIQEMLAQQSDFKDIARYREMATQQAAAAAEQAAQQQ